MTYILILGLIVLFILVFWFWGTYIDSGRFLKYRDRQSQTYTGTLVNYHGTASTSKSGQTVILDISIPFKGEDKIISIKETYSTVFISKLYIGKTFEVLYSPQYEKAKIILNQNDL